MGKETVIENCDVLRECSSSGSYISNYSYLKPSLSPSFSMASTSSSTCRLRLACSSSPSRSPILSLYSCTTVDKKVGGQTSRQETHTHT